MKQDEKISQLEDEIKVLKSELQSVLLDIRESYLNRENPFNPEVTAIPIQPAAAGFGNMGGQNLQPREDIRPKAVREPSYNDAGEETQIGEMDDVVNTKNRRREEAELKTNEPEAENKPVNKPAYKPQKDIVEETAHKEVTGVKQSEDKAVSDSVSQRPNLSSNGRVDLATIASLTQWIADTVRRLGRDRTEAILDIAEIVGYMTPQLKNILVKFVSRSPDECNGDNLTTRDYIASFIELESLLGMNSRSEEIALLSILCQEVRQ